MILRWQPLRTQIMLDVWTQENPCLATHSCQEGEEFSRKSGKQYVIATSIMDAEFVACFEATMHALWLQNFVSGLGIVDNIVRPLKFYYFNSTAIFLSKNDKYTKGAKNVDIKYLSVKEEVLKEKMSIKHIGTEMLLTNLLTKGFATQDICWSC